MANYFKQLNEAFDKKYGLNNVVESKRKLREANTDWYSMEWDDQVNAIKRFVKNYRGSKVFEDFAASVGADVDDVIDAFADMESYGVIEIPKEIQIDDKYRNDDIYESKRRKLKEAVDTYTSWFDLEFADQVAAIKDFVNKYRGTKVFEDFAASVGVDVEDVIDLFADMESRGVIDIPREIQVNSEYANDELYEGKGSPINWHSMDREDLDAQIAAIKDFVNNYHGTKVFEDFAASVGVDVDDIIDLFSDLEAYGVIDIPREIQIDDKYRNNDIYESKRKLKEARMSPEDQRDNEILRDIYHKTERRVNAALTPTERAVLNKYGLVRGKAPWTGPDVLKTNDYNGYNYTITSPYPHVAGGWDIDNDKVNLADRARKIDDRTMLRNFMAGADQSSDTTFDHDPKGNSKNTFQRKFNRATSAQMQKPIRDHRRGRTQKIKGYDESLKEATALEADKGKKAPLTSKPASISSMLLRNKSAIDNADDLNALISAVSAALSSKKDDKKVKEIMAKLNTMPDHAKALTYLYNLILKGDNLGVSGRKKYEGYDDGNNEIDRYQKWVDFDMSRYGKISKRTQQMVNKAGYQIIKDDHGDYEVAAGHFE